MVEKVLLASGRRIGHGQLANEDAFRLKLGEGAEVYTFLNNVYFAVTQEGEALKYTPLTAKPEGLA